MPRSRRFHTFDALAAFRDYRFLWTGNFFANSAQWMQLLTVTWLVRKLTVESDNPFLSSYSALLVATVGGINLLPGLVTGPWGGVLGDRIDRRKLVMAIQTFMAGLALLFAFLVSTGRVEVWHVYAYVIISGACLSVTQPMRQALIANTVPRHALGNAYAINVFTITGTRMIGPFVGGFLIASLGFFWNFTVEALFYAGMVVAFLPMKTPYYERRSATRQVSLLANLLEGIRYAWRENRVIFNLILLSLIPELILHPVWFLLPVFTEEVLQLGAGVGGVLLAATGFGGLVSTAIIASVGFVFKRGVVCLLAVAISAASVVLFAYSQWLALAIIVIALMSFGQATFRTTYGTLIQVLAPDALRGRLTSLQGYGRGFLVLTTLLTGWFIDFTSVQVGLIVIGALGLSLVAVAVLVFQRVRQLE